MFFWVHYKNSHEATSISWNFYMSNFDPPTFLRTTGRGVALPRKFPSTKCEYGIIEYIQKPTYLRANKEQRVESWWWRLTFAFDFWWWKKITENLGCYESFDGFSSRNCVISFSAYLFCKRSCVCCGKLRLLLEPPPNAESSLHDDLPCHQRRVPVPHCHKKRSRWPSLNWSWSNITVSWAKLNQNFSFSMCFFHVFKKKIHCNIYIYIFWCWMKLSFTS